MSFVGKCLILFLSIAAVNAADKEKERFAPGPASSYPARQTNGKVTIAVDPYDTEAKARPAFGKMNPYELGVLPVLVVIQNNAAQALDLRQMRIEYVSPDRQRIDPTPAKDVRFLHGAKRNDVPNQRRLPIPIPTGGKKNKLDSWEIEGLAFAAKMLPPGESAHGFYYFQTRHQVGSALYLTGLQEAGSGKELFYYEIPMQ
jgi:hypothetical protein